MDKQGKFYKKALVKYEDEFFINYEFICLHVDTFKEFKRKIQKIMKDVHSVEKYQIMCITPTNNEEVNALKKAFNNKVYQPVVTVDMIKNGCVKYE